MLKHLSRVKVNTYYSRFIKQHPTNNLPLAFQKTVNHGMAQDTDKAQELEAVKAAVKSKAAKKKKKPAASGSSSDSGSGSSGSRSSSSSRSSGSCSDSESSSSADSEAHKKKLKKKAKKEKLKIKKAAAAAAAAGETEVDAKTKVISWAFFLRGIVSEADRVIKKRLGFIRDQSWYNFR